MTGAAATGDDRNRFVATATYTALVGNAAKGIALDRGRALFAIPHARSEGHGKLLATQMLFGRFTEQVVPITGGTVKLRGKVLTDQGFHHAFRWSNGLGAGLVLLSMSYGVPNLIDSLTADDDRGLMESKGGRTGVFGTIANAAGAAAMVTAFAKAGPESGRLLRTLQHPVLASGPVVAALSALSIPVVANEFGLLDGLDA